MEVETEAEVEAETQAETTAEGDGGAAASRSATMQFGWEFEPAGGLALAAPAQAVDFTASGDLLVLVSEPHYLQAFEPTTGAAEGEGVVAYGAVEGRHVVEQTNRIAKEQGVKVGRAGRSPVAAVVSPPSHPPTHPTQVLPAIVLDDGRDEKFNPPPGQGKMAKQAKANGKAKVKADDGASAAEAAAKGGEEGGGGEGGEEGEDALPLELRKRKTLGQGRDFNKKPKAVPTVPGRGKR